MEGARGGGGEVVGGGGGGTRAGVKLVPFEPRQRGTLSRSVTITLSYR